MIRFSIIVPVYNVEKYLKRCLDSILCQSFRDYEVIIVNDGSTDGSPEIISGYSDERIRVISQENRGLGGARNTGVRQAQGEYLFFIDSDDFLEPKALAELERVLRVRSCDVVLTDAYSVFEPEPGQYVKHYFNMAGDFHGEVQVSEDTLPALFLLPPASWNKIVRRELFRKHGLTFPERLNYEDTLITRQVFAFADRVYFLKKPLYCYYQRADSIMRSRPGTDIFRVSDQLEAYFSGRKEFSCCQKAIEAIIIRNITGIYIEGSYLYGKSDSVEIREAQKMILERYPEWADNPYFSAVERNKLQVLLHKKYSAYVRGYVSPKSTLQHFLTLGASLKKVCRLIRQRGFSYVFGAVVQRIPCLCRSVDFAGDRSARADVIRHKINYLMCHRVAAEIDLPKDFPQFRVKGHSRAYQEFLLTPHSGNYEISYLFITDGHGKVLNYRAIPGYGYAFRKYRLPDGDTVCAYLQTVGKLNQAFDHTHLVILDPKLENETDRVSMLRGGSIPEDGYPCENHEYRILGHRHYIVSGVMNICVSDIPGFEGNEIGITNSIIQEQKDGAVLFRFELSEHPELYAAAIIPDDYTPYAVCGNEIEYADCGHLNSVDIDPGTGDWLLSFRSIGLVKISRKDGTVKWIMGRKRCDIRGISREQLCLYQHDARYLKDGSITVFDNYGSPDGKCRVCRYWIDEASLSLTGYREYKSNIKRSEYMGGAQAADDGSEIFELAYGSAYPYIAFEEYDFKKGRQNMQLVFKDGYDLYQISAGETEVPPICSP